MKLVWHLFRKDLARVKLFAAALFLLVALRPLLGVFALAKDELTYGVATRLENIDGILLIAHVVGAWLLAVWLAQLDSPRRPDAFLHTRPVSRRALWSAKFLGALALCVFALLLAWLPWWLGCGIAGADLRALIACHVSGLLLIVVPALTVGALVRDFRRAILASIVVAIIAVCLPVLLTVPGESRWRPFTDRDWVLRFTLWLLFGFSVVFALLGLLYRRHPRWTGFVAWAAASLALGIALHRTEWPAPLHPLPPRDPLANASAMTEPDHETDIRTAWAEDNAAAFPDLRVDLTSLRRNASNLEQGPLYALSARATGIAGLLPHIEVGTITFTDSNAQLLRFRKEALLADPYEDVARLLHPLPTQTAGPGFKNLIRFWDGAHAEGLDRLSGPLTMRADLRITLFRPVLGSHHPLKPTSWRRSPDGTGYRILSARDTTTPDSGVELKMAETHFDESGIWLLWRWLERPRSPLAGRVEVFDAQGRSVWKRHVQGGTRYTVAGVKVSHITYLLEMQSVKGPDGKWTTPAPTPEWCEGLSCAALDLVPVARVSRQLAADNVVVERKD